MTVAADHTYRRVDEYSLALPATYLDLKKFLRAIEVDHKDTPADKANVDTEYREEQELIVRVTIFEQR